MSCKRREDGARCFIEPRLRVPRSAEPARSAATVVRRPRSERGCDNYPSAPTTNMRRFPGGWQGRESPHLWTPPRRHAGRRTARSPRRRLHLSQRPPHARSHDRGKSNVGPEQQATDCQRGASRRLEDRVVGLMRRVFDRGDDVVPFERRVVCKDFFERSTRGQKVEDVRDTHPQASNAGPPSAFPLFHSNPFQSLDVHRLKITCLALDWQVQAAQLA